jgi:GNAT superfamily N-acetyltransferase
MPEIQIRPVIASDIPSLVSLDHSYTTDRVWQLEYTHDRDETGEPRLQVAVSFREIRLPRTVKVSYPRPFQQLETDWMHRSGLLVALFESYPIGYISLALGFAPNITWVTDLVVESQLRRKSIGSALVFAALEWAANMDARTLIIEMQPKNYPSIQLALKLGFEFCGYNDRHYPDHEIGLFFANSTR